MRGVLISGGNGKLAQKLVEYNTEYEMIPLGKSELDVTNPSNIESIIDKFSPDIFIHAAALTGPMAQHNEFPDTSIQTNIIGTSNVVLECMKRNIKLVYISTDFVYPGTEGDYKESDGVFPVNKYAWSKLGGECAVKIYDNSLILRIAMCDKPYPHSKALVDLKKSTIFNADAARIVLKLLDETGIINVGGDPMFVYDFAKKTNSKIGKIFLKDIHDVEMPTDASMNCEKLEKFCAK
jgi:dTDP-4-dehydrorhamnose reductase